MAWSIGTLVFGDICIDAVYLHGLFRCVFVPLRACCCARRTVLAVLMVGRTGIFNRICAGRRLKSVRYRKGHHRRSMVRQANNIACEFQRRVHAEAAYLALEPVGGLASSSLGGQRLH